MNTVDTNSTDQSPEQSPEFGFFKIPIPPGATEKPTITGCQVPIDTHIIGFRREAPAGVAIYAAGSLQAERVVRHLAFVPGDFGGLPKGARYIDSIETDGPLHGQTRQLFLMEIPSEEIESLSSPVSGQETTATEDRTDG